MAGPYTITPPVQGQPIPSVGFGLAVKNAINDLDARAAAVEGSQQLVIARGRRTTTTGNITTTETGVLRIDNIQVKAGRLYQITTGPVNMDTSVSADIGSVRLRLSTSGAATTSSTLIGYMRQLIDDATQSNVVSLNAWYLAPADATISILLSLIRQGGTGNLIIFCSASGDILDLVVQYAGVDPGDTGVVL